MSYLTQLQEKYGRRPIWLYDFTIGATTHRLCANAGGYTYNGNTYITTPLVHSKIPISVSTNRANVNIELPASNTVARSLLGDLGIVDTELRILQGFRDDPAQEFVTMFVGRVANIEPTKTRIRMTIENEMTTLNRKAIPAVMQRPCRHVVYHGACGLTLASFQSAATATAYDGSVVTSADAAGQANDYYSGGVLTFNGTPQMVVKHKGNKLTMLGVVPGLEESIATNGNAAIMLAPGCDLTRQTCKARFNNLDNYGGFPWMGDNPFSGRSIV